MEGKARAMPTSAPADVDPPKTVIVVESAPDTSVAELLRVLAHATDFGQSATQLAHARSKPRPSLDGLLDASGRSASSSADSDDGIAGGMMARLYARLARVLCAMHVVSMCVCAFPHACFCGAFIAHFRDDDRRIAQSVHFLSQLARVARALAHGRRRLLVLHPGV